ALVAVLFQPVGQDQAEGEVVGRLAGLVEQAEQLGLQRGHRGGLRRLASSAYSTQPGRLYRHGRCKRSPFAEPRICHPYPIRYTPNSLRRGPGAPPARGWRRRIGQGEETWGLK